MTPNMAQYVRLCKSVSDFGKLIPKDQVLDHVDPEKPFYTSLFYYNDDHFKTFKEKGSIRGIKDVTTDRLWFDFDDEKNPKAAQDDAIEVVSRLNQSGINNKDIEIYFSGNKGFNVLVTLNRLLTPDQVQSLAVNKFGKDLSTFDYSMYDAPQILRVPGTRHNSSNLYKIPLTLTELKSLSIDEIKKKAASLENVTEDFEWEPVSISEDLIEQPKKLEVIKPTTNVPTTLDLENKPKHWKHYKWALFQGHFNVGERHNAMMVIAATCRGLGYDQETTVAMCYAADKKHCEMTKDHTIEDLETNIIPSVFSDNWNGGQFSYKNNPWLQAYCRRMNIEVSKEETGLVQVTDIQKIFEDYSINFDKNIIKTGIPTIDENVTFLTSTHNGLLGQPGSGKTSFALEWLQNASAEDVHCSFYSLDMGGPVIYSKLIQMEIGCSFKEAVRLRRDNPSKFIEISKKIEQKVRNVKFNFRSGITVEDIKNDILTFQESTGNKIKLVIIDYLECLSGPYSDPLANTAFISQQMKDLANELQVCTVMLLQTQKHSTTEISDPMLSMKMIKGSSVIEQASSVILSLWREGYNPKTVDRDKYVSFAAVKNRFGSLWTDDFKWEGKRGMVSELSEEERDNLAELRKDKKEAKAAESSGGSWA